MMEKTPFRFLRQSCRELSYTEREFFPNLPSISSVDPLQGQRAPFCTCRHHPFGALNLLKSATAADISD
jgi:hypothetical protein